MKLHLPVSLRKSVLSCIIASAAVAVSSNVALAVTESTPQNLVFDGTTLIWNTAAENKVFTNAEGQVTSFTSGDNVSFENDAAVSLGEDIAAGQIDIADGADVVIDLADNGLNFDTLSMLGGSLDVGPSLNLNAGETLAVGPNGSVLKSALMFGAESCLSVDFSGSGTATSLNNSFISLLNGSQLLLSGCGNGDGKTYTLLTDVSELRDAQGNTIILRASNNAISNYFDVTQPGTGFWANSTLLLTDEGALQLVLHDQKVRESVTITTRKEYGTQYQFYTKVVFEDVESPLPSMCGGAINGENSSVSLNNNGCLEFKGNSVSSTDYFYGNGAGGAIFGSSVALSYNGSIKFRGNCAKDGGAISGNKIVLFANNEIEFSENQADVWGGAICVTGEVELNDNGSLIFCDNYSSYEGGAIYGYHAIKVALNNNGCVRFTGNAADEGGGAVYCGNITVNDNGRVEFVENFVTTGYGRGGAIYGASAELNNNESVLFMGNDVAGSSARGGAICGEWYGAITLSNNNSVTFSSNKATSSGNNAQGGALCGVIILSDNGCVEFCENTVVSGYHAYGGAICGDTNTVSLIRNEDITFRKNSASSWSEDIACTYGGAICARNLILNDNGNVEFSSNTASSSHIVRGGAIDVFGSLCIRNNETVVFKKNAEVQDGVYRLRSIYSWGSGTVLSTALGKSIEFWDSLYVADGATVSLNAEYSDSSGTVHKQQGDILFTGAYTESHLAEVKGYAGTDDEIHNSRTSEVYTMTNLYGGRLRVEDGAIYKGYGITAHAGSDSTVLVKDAVLSHVGNELHFYEGTRLESMGESEIFGDVIVESTATAAFSALTRLEGSLTLVSGSELSLAGELTLNGTLRLGTSLTLSGDMLEMVNLLQAGQSLTLMVGIDSLAVQTSDLLRSAAYTDVMSGQCLQASNYFINLGADSGLVLMYDGAVGSLSMSKGEVIPEPAIPTLSLLALATLASRRRRKEI